MRELDRVARRCHEDQRRARGHHPRARPPTAQQMRRHRDRTAHHVPRAATVLSGSTGDAVLNQHHIIASDAAPFPGTDIGQQAVRHAPSGSPTFVVAALRRGYHARTEASSFQGAGAWTRGVQARPPRIVSDGCSGRRITSGTGATARQAGRA